MKGAVFNEWVEDILKRVEDCKGIFNNSEDVSKFEIFQNFKFSLWGI